MADTGGVSPSAPMPAPGTGSAADRLWWFRSAGDPRLPAPRTRWRPTRQQRLDALACLGVAALWFSQACRETLFRADRDFYNRVPVGGPVLVSLVLSIVVLAAAGFLGVQLLRRTRRPLWLRLGAVVVATALLAALNFARITYEAAGRSAGMLGGTGLLALAVLALVAALVWPRPALRAMRWTAVLVSPVAFVTLAFGLWMFLEVAAGPVWRLAEPAPLKRTPPSLRRVVWVVLEELDQRVTFEARPPGLELPELDRLRRESLYADGARPPAGTTELSMPALIIGRPVFGAVPLNPNDLDLTFADGKTGRWSAQANVFTRARTLGYDTALVGWHLPYPRVLGGALGVADWRPSAAYESTRGATFGESVWNQWASLAPPVNVRRLSAQRFEELGHLAIRAATDGRFGLVLLHLPAPQPPAIYDRATGRLTAWSFAGPAASYLDNLALTDRLLGELRRGLQRARLDDRTWLVVTSSRWWRTSKQYDGHEDPRVPFLVRPPDGGRAAHVDTTFNTLGAHDLILAILRGTVGDTTDAAAWLARQPVAPPRDYTSHGRPVY
jgi:hypothetical protein